MSNHSDPIVPHVLVVGEQRHPWKLGAIERLTTKYHTATTVRVSDGTRDRSEQQAHVYCLADDAALASAEACRRVLQAAIDSLAAELRSLGSYAARLAEAGGIKLAPNPLTPWVVEARDPDHDSGWLFFRPVPSIARRAIIGHTPLMLRGPSSYDPNESYLFHQRDHFVCPDDATWERIETRIAEAERAAADWEQLKRKLGTYSEALADGRYAQKDEETMSTPDQAVIPTYPPPLGMLSVEVLELARRYIAARRRSGEALLEAARLLAEARETAQHGEWSVFLEATQTSVDVAEGLLRIHAQSGSDPAFAEAVRSNWLSQSAAALVARDSTPAAARERILTSPAPPTARDVRAIIQEEKTRNVTENAEPNTAPDPRFADAKQRFAALGGWKLEMHGLWYKLSKPDGEHYATTQTLDPQINTLEHFEAGARRRAAEAVKPPDVFEADSAALALRTDGWIVQRAAAGLWRVGRTPGVALLELDDEALIVAESLVADRANAGRPPLDSEMLYHALTVAGVVDSDLVVGQRAEPQQADPVAPPSVAELVNRAATQIRAANRDNPAYQADASYADALKAQVSARATALLRTGFAVLRSETIVLRVLALGICDRDQKSLIAEMPLDQLHDLLIGRILAGAWSGDATPLLALLKLPTERAAQQVSGVRGRVSGAVSSPETRNPVPDTRADPLARIRERLPQIDVATLTRDEAEWKLNQLRILKQDLAMRADAPGVSDADYEALLRQIGDARRALAERLAVKEEVTA